jgi:glycerophosphoryl diester phosphodiesterase
MSYPISEKRPLRIGHRGAAAYAPHNTLTGFRKAAELGADMVELDVQRCADGQVVVIHDLYLRAPGGKVLPVHDTTLADLQAIDQGGGERIPTFPEALATLRQLNLGILIELKDGYAAPLVIEALREQDYTDHCVVSSFRPDWLADFKAAVPQIEMSIQAGSKAIDGPHVVSLAWVCGASFVCPGWESNPHPSALLTSDWLGAVRAAGLRVISWHEERPAEIAALKQLGVDGICSDRPDLLL